MSLLPQTIINGIMLGSVYAMVALGLTLIFGILEIPNFAHGALYMIGAFIAFFCITSLGVSYWIALVLSLAALFIAGMVIERFIFRPFYKQPHVSSFIVAVGLILILENGALVLWGADFRRISPPNSGIINLLGITVTFQRLIVILFAALLIIAIHLFIKKTRLGAAIEATSQNREGAQLMGINTSFVGQVTFGLGTALAAVAAVLVAPILLISATMGESVIAMAFVIIILGGMGSFIGAVVGGYVIGLLETLVSTYVTSYYVEALIFGVLVLVLAVKPTGLFGGKH
ncbi:MAG: branched-chain amino acid ABC transporter permease [Thermodesulfobacteriota bacterium]